MKYFLESEAGNAAKQTIMTIRGLYMSELLPVTLDMNAKNLTISNYAPVGNGAEGKLIVRASGQTARNMRKKTGSMNLLPVEFWEAPGISARDRDYMMGAYALAEVRMSKIFCNNVIHFGRILDRIQAEGAQMVEDVRRGAFSVPLSPEVRRTLAESFPPKPERAAELQAILDEQGCLIKNRADIARIWPQLSMMSCWLAATVGRDAREVLRRLPEGFQCFDLGYGASESKLNIPTKLASASGVAAPFACFYEFLPLDCLDSGDGAPLCMWEVEPGAHYVLLITTYSGLYRYNMEDIVQVEGFVGRTPSIVFCGKSSEFVLARTADGGVRKIYGYQFADLVREAERRLGVEFDLLQVLDEDGDYTYLLESKQDVDYAAVKALLDELSLEQWGARSRAVLEMDHGYKDALFTGRTREDRGACGIKLPVVVREAPQPEYVTRTVK